jgi:hypothetical protein
VNRPRHVAALLAACCLAACAPGPNTSYVSSLSDPADATVIAAGIGAFMQTQFPAESTTLVLDPTQADQAGDVLTPALRDTLRQQGFALAQAAVPAGAHTLRYWVTPLDGSSVLVRLMIDGRQQAARFFARNSAGNLQSGGPFTVMRTEASL